MTFAKNDHSWKDVTKKVTIYKFAINNEIGQAMWRITRNSFAEARAFNADLILIHMNTYGGALDAADSIRTTILNSPIPVYVFVDNNAASAGALISVAADRIYMREGASIGAATVVNQTGQAMPDKYQSFMRSMMRATAQSHGTDTLIRGKDTVYIWKRDPLIAEAMVDPRTYIPGVNDSGKVLTFTTNEAIKHHYCEGKANTLEAVIAVIGIRTFEMKEYHITLREKAIGILVNPFIQGILIMLIIAGIYFEMQTPGVTFPIAISVIAALLYFAPSYLDGLASHWEILLFIAGVILIALEVFVVPGFGITGISGIALVIVGLTLSMVDKTIFSYDTGKAFNVIIKALFIVIMSMSLSLALSIYFSSKLLRSTRFDGLTLRAEQNSSLGYVSFENRSSVIGEEGVATTLLRPSGKVDVGGEIFDAISETGYINAGEKVKVTRYETGQIYVVKI